MTGLKNFKEYLVLLTENPARAGMKAAKEDDILRDKLRAKKKIGKLSTKEQKELDKLEGKNK